MCSCCEHSVENVPYVSARIIRKADIQAFLKPLGFDFTGNVIDFINAYSNAFSEHIPYFDDSKYCFDLTIHELLKSIKGTLCVEFNDLRDYYCISYLDFKNYIKESGDSAPSFLKYVDVWLSSLDSLNDLDIIYWNFDDYIEVVANI